MNGADIAADLHLHTTTSDGTDTIPERVEQANEHGLLAIAITDHDRIPPTLNERVTERKGLKVITGVEIRADIVDTKVEILGYFVDPSANELQEVLSLARENRRARNRELVERLSTETGLNLDYDALAASVEGSLARPHLANILVEENVVGSVAEAFQNYLAEDGSCFVPMERVPYGEVIEAIHAAGGVASLAHPGRIRSDRVSEMIENMADAGLDAIEVWYPYGNRGDAYADIGVAEANTLAERHGLVRTGGSDCHGSESSKYRIGSVGVNDDTVRALENAAENR